MMKDLKQRLKKGKTNIWSKIYNYRKAQLFALLMVEDVEVLENVFRWTVSFSVTLIWSGFAIRNPGLGISSGHHICAPRKATHVVSPFWALNDCASKRSICH